MTEQQPKSADPTRPRIAFRRGGLTRRTNREAILSGLEFIFANQKDHHWEDFTALGEGPEIWVTACVLARLAELPGDLLNRDFRVRIEESLRWLLQARTGEGLWGAGREMEPDADTSAWAVIALRRNGRTTTPEVLDFLRRCQRPNGGFAAYPETSQMDGLYKLSAADTTVAAMKALGYPNPRAEDFLAARVQTDVSGSWCRLASRFQLYAEMLEMEETTVSWFLLNKAGQLAAQYSPDSAFELSHLLRCLFQMRMQRAWSEAVNLRQLQLQDGSWPASAILGPAMPGIMVRRRPHVVIADDQRIITTVTAVSALAMGESQPGLYFGSDLPQPRRYSES